jgi:glycosyltransferase involved in cell wall biosynthesis
VAIYHNLPPGGALRVLHEFVRRSNDEHVYDLYTLDLGPLDAFAYARGRAEPHDLTPYVARSFRYPVVAGFAARALVGDAWRLTALHWMDRVQRRVAADINRRRYDVVLVNSCQITHAPSLLRHLEVPSLYYMQEPRRRSFEAGYQPRAAAAPLARQAVAAALEQALRRRDREASLAADRIACNSYYSAESIQRAYGLDATVCYLAVDGDVFGTTPHGSGLDRRESIMSVGSLEAFKCHDIVIKTLALLPEAGRPALDLVYERCDPAYRADVEALAASSGVELRLHAGIADAQLAQLYRAAAATVVAARLEPFGLVPLESLACGTPVVAVREGGYRETVVDGVNGYLVDRSPAAVAAGLSRVLAGGLERTPEQLRRTVLPVWGWDGAVKRQLEELAITADGRRE